MTTTARGRGETKLGATLLAVGFALAVVGLVVEVAVHGGAGPAVPETWETTSTAAGLVLVGLGLLAAIVGIGLRGRGLRRGRATPATFLDADEEERVLAAIRAFENRTSGELRVHLEPHVDGPILDAARRTFEELGMTETADRNGVLFFVAVRDRKFAVLGDAGINQRVSEGFWQEVVAAVREEFARGRFAEGLVRGVDIAGHALAEFFPVQPDDVNELPDGISRG
jgi:uncharacterized membrane protein